MQTTFETTLPKHIPFPAIEEQPDYLVEGLSFVVSLLCVGCQYLILYPTVWWLPEFANKQALHFHLIDKVLVVLVFVVLILSRKCVALFVYSASTYIRKRQKSKSYNLLATLIPHIYSLQLFLLLGVCCFDVYLKFGLWKLLGLCYPLILYVIIFRPLRNPLEPFFRTLFESPATKYLHGVPVHCCTASCQAATVRSEIDGLRIDLNARFNQTIFSSIVCGYYAGLTPYLFADQRLVYDPLTVLLNAVFIWVSSLTLSAVQCFSPAYVDILHRAALHLGQWRVHHLASSSSSSSHVIAWTPLLKCPPGTVVRHEGEIYQATGPICTAIPGNSSHYRFYALFRNPTTTIYGTLTSIQLLLTAAQFLTLYHTKAWHGVIALSFLTFANFVPLFCLLRNLRVTHSIYSEEAAIYAEATGVSRS